MEVWSGTPTSDQGFHRFGWSPATLGRCPTRRRHMIAQEFLHPPSMVSESCCHRGRTRGPFETSVRIEHAQTLMRTTKVIDRAHQIQAVLQRVLLPQHGAAASHPATQACPKEPALSGARKRAQSKGCIQ